MQQGMVFTGVKCIMETTKDLTCLETLACIPPYIWRVSWLHFDIRELDKAVLSSFFFIGDKDLIV